MIPVKRFTGSLVAWLALAAAPSISTAASELKSIHTSCVEATLAASESGTCWISFDGSIAEGDAARIEALVRNAEHVVTMLSMGSMGGNAREAVKIADLLNKYGIEFQVLSMCRSEAKCVKALPHGVCASACGVVYLLANSRSQIGRFARVLLHRPYFPPGAFSRLNSSEARAAYETAAAMITSRLREAGVGDDTIRTLMNTSSADAVALRADYPNHTPWLDEWLIARCGPEPLLDGEFDQVMKQSIAHAACEKAQLASEAKRLQRK